MAVAHVVGQSFHVLPLLYEYLALHISVVIRHKCPTPRIRKPMRSIPHATHTMPVPTCAITHPTHPVPPRGRPMPPPTTPCHTQFTPCPPTPPVTICPSPTHPPNAPVATSNFYHATSNHRLRQPKCFQIFSFSQVLFLYGQNHGGAPQQRI